MNETKAVAVPTGEDAPTDVIVRGDTTGFLQEIDVGRFHLQADEPAEIGGTDRAPTPYDYLLAALGACTSMTVGLYARKKQWPLENVTVALHHSRIHARDCSDCETKNGMLDRIDLRVRLVGNLSDEQRMKLLEIAHKCPVHRTLTSEVKINVQMEK
ncbi:MAG TPA: OsmC family protein [Chthoniobacterales bacterium]